MKKTKVSKRSTLSTDTKLIPHFLIVILIFVLGLLVYHKSFNSNFIFDDEALILNNPLIKNFEYLRDIFTKHLFFGSGEYSNFYRPIQSLSLMIDYHLWELKPFGYHLTNVLIHIFCALSVYFLIFLISKKQGIAIMTGLLFCVHTVLSWSVYYIASRADTLSALFFILSIVLYIKYKQVDLKRSSVFLYLGSVVCFIISILSKENAILLPFILLLYLYCFREDIEKPKRKSPNLTWIFFLIAAIYIYLRATVLNFSQGRLLETTTAPIPLYNRLLTTSKVIMIYFRLLLLPIGLHMEWNIEPARSLIQDEVFLSVGALIIVGIFAYFFSRTSKLKFFMISWFFITLLPYFNIFPLAYFMGEAWLYLPSAGFFALFAMYLYEIARRSKLWSYTVIGIVVSAILFYSILTIRRAGVWADPINLYAEVLKYSPNNTKARINLAAILQRKGLDSEAISKYTEATSLNPEETTGYINLAVLYFEKKMYDEALEELKKVVALTPKDYVRYNDIGVCYRKKGDSKKAMEAYERALEINPEYSITYNNIGNVYRDLKQYDAAISSYKKAIELEPDKAVFYRNLGTVYKAKGMLEQASVAFEKASELQLDNIDEQ